jgi:hypothetical protein
VGYDLNTSIVDVVTSLRPRLIGAALPERKKAQMMPKTLEQDVWMPLLSPYALGQAQR